MGSITSADPTERSRGLVERLNSLVHVVYTHPSAKWIRRARSSTPAGRSASPGLVAEGPRTSATCLFCRRDDRTANIVIFENASCFARLDNFPAAPGHVEVVPKRHVVSFFDLMPEEVADLFELLGRARRRLDQERSPDGYTIGVNEGRAAGRSIDHLHVHLIPRHVGDVADPRGGVRQVVPNCDPDLWLANGTTG